MFKRYADIILVTEPQEKIICHSFELVKICEILFGKVSSQESCHTIFHFAIFNLAVFSFFNADEGGAGHNFWPSETRTRSNYFPHNASGKLGRFLEIGGWGCFY